MSQRTAPSEDHAARGRGRERAGGEPGRPPSPHPILRLQRSIGNAAVRRLLRARDPFLEAVTGPLTKAYHEARKARQAYVEGGKRGPITYDPSKRNKTNYYGGFDVEYDPADDKQLLSVKLRGVADFQPGMRLRQGRAVPVETSPATRTAADAINKLKDPAKRATEVAKWQWSSGGGPDAGDEGRFLAGFKRSVEDAWQGKHAFYCWRPWWEDLGATVAIDVNLVKMDPFHQPGAPNHMRTVVYKVPADFLVGKSEVHRSGGNQAKAGPYANVMVLTSSDVAPRRDSLRTTYISFDLGESGLSDDAKKELKALAKDMPNAPQGATAEVSDLHLSARGLDIGERKARFENIADVLVGAGMSRSRIKYLDGGQGNAVEIVIGGGPAQTVAAHETGHMFGLDDEYTGAGAYGAGKKTEHTDLAAKAHEWGVMHARSDSIMSEGSIVRRQHYVTFLDALKVVSGIEEWTFGDPHWMGPPSPYDDAPMPDHMDDGRGRRPPARYV